MPFGMLYGARASKVWLGMDPELRAFLIVLRRALLMVVRHIEQSCHIGEQHD